MTRKEQYTKDLETAALFIENDIYIQRMFGEKIAKRVSRLAARLRNYGCLNPFREPDKKVERKGKGK